MKLNAILSGAFAALIASGVAYAALTPIPTGQNVIPAPPGSYRNAGTQTTGWSLYFAHGQVYMFIQGAGTLSTGTLYTEPNPVDGQRECFASNQIQTALTWTAFASSQTVNTAADPPAALGAPVCQTFQSSAATWFPSP